MPYRIVILSILLFVFPALVFSQALSDDDAKEPAKNLRLAAAKMLKAYTSRDFQTSADLIHPNAVQVFFGGRNRLIEALEMTAHKLDSQNYIMTGGAIQGISKIYRSGKELHAVVTQSVRARIPNGGINSITSLLAISSDNGLTWTFIGIGSWKRDDLQKVIPGLSAELEIPEPIRPTIIPD